ncbi:phosphate uptake regulator PhoU [Candidatus Woesearchaeota archaeon]|nr:phosphate uptake regulator PhoU [Candidatus Woesearchaeota archaeon]
MKRSIVQHGSSSLTITLPRKWVEKFKLNKGDELEVEESGSRIIISTQQESGSSKKEFSDKESGIFTGNNLSHLYQLGYDEVEIRFSDSKTVDEVKRRLPNCMGWEIIDQTEKKIYIKSIATTLETEFEQLLRKSFLLINELAKGLAEVLEKQQYGRLPELRALEQLNNKFTDVCIRILNKRGYSQANRTMQMYEIVKNIERIADEFKYICDLFGPYQPGKKIEPELLKLFKEVVEYYFAFYHLFYKFDADAKKKIYLGRKPLYSKLMHKLKTSKGDGSVFLCHLQNIVQKTYDGAGGYFALVL